MRSGSGGSWAPSQLKGGEVLQTPQPLFKKLEAKIVDEERARLGRSKDAA